MKRLVICGICLALAACSTTPDELDKKQGTARSEKTYAENYQLVFRRLSETAKRCDSAPGTASFVVDAQLYNELGFGEVSQSMLSALYPRNYYWKAKIEKVGSGAKVSIVAGNTLAQNVILRRVSSWADGATNCV